DRPRVRPPAPVQAVLILYLLSHSTLYFVADEFFDSRYFYGPLLAFDTLVLTVVLSTSGTANVDFYIACVLTIILSCICNEARGLLLVTLLAPLAYGYFAFSSDPGLDPALYLRLPFPFVISLFYGYFAQVERLRTVARERHEQVKKQQRSAEEIRRQRERLEVLHEINLSVTSTIDAQKVLEVFLERALIHLPYAAALIRLRNPQSNSIETVAAKGIKTKEMQLAHDALFFIDGLVDHSTPLVVQNVFADSRVAKSDFFQEYGLVSFIALPLLADNQEWGDLVFLTREEHEFGDEEIGFLSTLAGQVASAIHHARLYEQSQRQAEELGQAHKIKDDFLKVVSNELKTPLNIVLGYTDMFLEGLLGTLTPIQEKAIETVGRQSRELQRLIESVLQVSSLESEELHADYHEVNLWEFLSEIRSIYAALPSQSVGLLWDYPADLPTVQSDRGKLKHILVNLIDNGLKFTDHGAVTVSVRYMVSKKILQIRVADTGIGIPPSETASIFERFHQVQDSHARTPHGVGLGLYIVKKYMDFFNGTIQVESRPVEGSVFILRIPAPPYRASVVHEQLPLLAGTEHL
ncbi:MAG: ATP-binding protein, partial [Candidatus Binatia bacterium]